MHLEKKSTQIYKTRIDKVIQYITFNLGEKLSLEKLAKEAYFSPFHFHRLFSAIIGETPNEFINRLRIEKAAGMLLYNPNNSITEIAIVCGFSSSASFSRSFKQYFGFSATELRKSGKSKIRQKLSKECKIITLRHDYLLTDQLNSQNNPNRRFSMDVKIKIMPEFRVAYMAQNEGYITEKIHKTWDQLCKWGAARDLLNQDTLLIGISFDDPEITPLNKCRYYACFTVPPEVQGDDQVGIYNIEGGKYAVYHFEGTEIQIMTTYKAVYGEWLPSSGYQPDDKPCYEIYLNNPDTDPEGKYFMDIYLPVKPL